MLIISHRGNTNGVNESLENNPTHIKELINSNIQTEIDVWCIDNDLLLGHDYPQYKVTDEFIKMNGLWCHAKNIDAFHYMLKSKIRNCFWHENDNFTLTSSGFIWTYPNKSITDMSIIVDLDKNWKDKEYNCYGVCVDYL